MLVTQASRRRTRCVWPIVAFLLFAGMMHAQGALAVLTVTPSNESTTASTAADIVCTFAGPLLSASVTPQRVQVFGRWSGVVPGVLSVSGATLTFKPLRPYFAGERVSVMLASGIQSTGGQSLIGGYGFAFWTRPRAGSGSYSLVNTYSFRQPGEGLVRTYGFYAGDIDGDGSPDMSATNEVSSDVRVLRNDGCGNYGMMVIHAMPAGEEPSPNEGADFNGDGLIDLVTGNQSSNSIGFFMNDGNGGFLAPTFLTTSGNCHGVTVLDVEGDGDTDVAATNLSTVTIYLNDGTGVFSQGASFDGGSGEWQIAAADANGDGRTDLFVADFFSGRVTLLRNAGGGTFVTSASRSTNGSGTWAIAVGDVDGDGFADAVASNNGSSSAAVVRGDGAGGLLPAVTYGVGSNPVAVDLGDLDGDGDLDLSVAAFSSANCTVYTNDGAGNFVAPFVLTSPQAASCSVLVDYDRDGDLDIFVTDELADVARVFRQTEPAAPGIQPMSCDAALRFDNLAGHAGFAGANPTPLPQSTTAFAGVSGAPFAPFLLALGNPSAPGTPSAFGLVNLALDPFLAIIVDGFAGSPAGFLDAHGEALFSAPITTLIPPGVTFTLQAAVLGGGGVVLSNPETAIVTL